MRNKNWQWNDAELTPKTFKEWMTLASGPSGQQNPVHEALQRGCGLQVPEVVRLARPPEGGDPKERKVLLLLQLQVAAHPEFDIDLPKGVKLTKYDDLGLDVEPPPKKAAGAPETPAEEEPKAEAKEEPTKEPEEAEEPAAAPNGRSTVTAIGTKDLTMLRADVAKLKEDLSEQKQLTAQMAEQLTEALQWVREIHLGYRLLIMQDEGLQDIIDDPSIQNSLWRQSFRIEPTKEQGKKQEEARGNG